MPELNERGHHFFFVLEVFEDGEDGVVSAFRSQVAAHWPGLERSPSWLVWACTTGHRHTQAAQGVVPTGGPANPAGTARMHSAVSVNACGGAGGCRWGGVLQSCAEMGRRLG
ncbi:hypothetical protein C8R45DRAFT_928966 [Mycena sanguinolenta]|nr:hypothetical protein C8R45DRAFT_928966 [Mycena sanguinolenta]